MPGSSPSPRRTLQDWLAVWRHRLERADFSTASKNFFHPGNVLSLAFIVLIIGFGMQGSVAAGVLPASFLAVAAPSLLIICSVFVVASAFLTIAWSIYRFWGDYNEMYRQFETLQAEIVKELALPPSQTNTISHKNPETNANIKRIWNSRPGGPQFIGTLKYFGLDISDTRLFPDKIGPQGEAPNDTDDEDDDGSLLKVLGCQQYIPTRVEAFLQNKQFSYWTYTKFLFHEWSTHLANRVESIITVLLIIIAVTLTVCYFVGAASFMAAMFNTIVGFFDVAFAGLGMGGVALSHAHVAAMALAGIAFCLGSMNLTATLQRTVRILYNFFDGLLTEPPEGFAEREQERRRPEVVQQVHVKSEGVPLLSENHLNPHSNNNVVAVGNLEKRPG